MGFHHFADLNLIFIEATCVEDERRISTFRLKVVFLVKLSHLVQMYDLFKDSNIRGVFRVRWRVLHLSIFVGTFFVSDLFQMLVLNHYLMGLVLCVFHRLILLRDTMIESWFHDFVDLDVTKELGGGFVQLFFLVTDLNFVHEVTVYFPEILVFIIFNFRVKIRVFRRLFYIFDCDLRFWLVWVGCYIQGHRLVLFRVQIRRGVFLFFLERRFLLCNSAEDLFLFI